MLGAHTQVKQEQAPDSTSTWYTTNDATFEVTGVQLEVGSVATDFEHRSFGQELKLCSRYYQKSYNYSTALGTATNSGAITNTAYDALLLQGFLFNLKQE